MTQEQQSQFTKALTRAIAQGIAIIGTGHLKANNAKCWFVQGTSEKYMVVQADDQSLTCTCKAGQQGKYCKHRAIVTAGIMEDASQFVDEMSANTSDTAFVAPKSDVMPFLKASRKKAVR